MKFIQKFIYAYMRMHIWNTYYVMIFFWLMTTKCVFSKDFFHFKIWRKNFLRRFFDFTHFHRQGPHVGVSNFFQAPRELAPLFLRAINIFIQVIFQNIITYLDITFKEEHNYINVIVRQNAVRTSWTSLRFPGLLLFLVYNGFIWHSQIKPF